MDEAFEQRVYSENPARDARAIMRVIKSFLLPKYQDTEHIGPVVEVSTPMNLKWSRYGSCAMFDSEMFFPRVSDVNKPAWRAAKYVCATCIVREKCLDVADEYEKTVKDNTMVWGVWGGLDPTERIARRRATKAAYRRKNRQTAPNAEQPAA